MIDDTNFNQEWLEAQVELAREYMNSVNPDIELPIVADKVICFRRYKVNNSIEYLREE